MKKYSQWQLAVSSHTHYSVDTHIHNPLQDALTVIQHMWDISTAIFAFHFPILYLSFYVYIISFPPNSS